MTILREQAETIERLREHRLFASRAGGRILGERRCKHEGEHNRA
jgi:hypothetical protein